MKNQHFLHFVLATCLLFNAHDAKAFLDASPVSKTPANSVFELNREALLQKDKAALELEIGRKLTFKEKIVLKSVKRKLKDNPELSGLNARDQVAVENLAVTGFALGIIGLIFPVAAIAAIIVSGKALRRMKKSPEKEKGKGFAIAGLILGLLPIVLLIILVAVWLISGGGLSFFDPSLFSNP